MDMKTKPTRKVKDAILSFYSNKFVLSEADI